MKLQPWMLIAALVLVLLLLAPRPAAAVTDVVPRDPPLDRTVWPGPNGLCPAGYFPSPTKIATGLTPVGGCIGLGNLTGAIGVAPPSSDGKKVGAAVGGTIGAVGGSFLGPLAAPAAAVGSALGSLFGGLFD